MRSNRDYNSNREFLHSALRIIQRTLKSPANHGNRCELLFIPGAKSLRFISQSKRWILVLPDNAKQWKNNFRTRKIIYGVLISCRLNLPKMGQLEYLPDWVVAAIDEGVSNSHNSGVSVAVRRRFPVTRGLLATKNKLPNFRMMTELDLKLLPVEAQMWYRELSRLLFEILADKKLLSPFFSDLATMNDPSPWYKSIVEKIGNEKLQCHLELSAMKIVWFNLAPAPPQLLLKRLPELETVELSELDANHNPTGKILKVKLDELPALLASRPDGELIRNHLIRKFINLTKFQDVTTRRVAVKAVPAIRKLGIDEAALSEFRKISGELSAHLRTRIAVERQLRESEVTLLPVGQYYRQRLKAWKSPQSALSDGELTDLERIEKSYRIE